MSLQVKKTITNQHEEEIKASIYYLYDYDISTFESEIERTLKDLSKRIIGYKYAKFKVVFVIDELDQAAAWQGYSSNNKYENVV